MTRHEGPPSDHFDGKKFFNPGVNNDKSMWEVLKWKLTSTVAEWPKWIDIEKTKWTAKAPTEERIQVTLINHATVLVEWGKYNILTDPVFSDRTSPVTWAGPKRVKSPGIELENLPPIHIVLISHNHYDHLDLASVEKLHKKFNPKFFVPLGDCALLKTIEGIRCEEMDWWQKIATEDLEIHFTPCQHWSARTLFDRNHSLWGSYVLKNKNRQIYFAGDTGYGPHFKTVNEKFGPMDLSLLPIGAYEPRWFMKTQHMNPEEAVLAHEDLQSKKSLGVHFGTFQLTDEGIGEPQAALAKALEEHKIASEKFVALENGATFWLSD